MTTKTEVFNKGDLITYPRDSKIFEVRGRHVGRDGATYLYDLLDEENMTTFYAVSLRGCTKAAR